MTAQLGTYPAWGVLVKGMPEHVMFALRPLQPGFDLGNFVVRTHGEWTAAFSMEANDTSEDAGAQLLRSEGLVPVYFFDFSKYGYTTKKWDGTEWSDDAEPSKILGPLGIAIPGHDTPLALDPRWALEVRYASVVEGASVDQVRALVPDVDLDVVAGPLGGVVYDADANTRCDLAERGQHRVFQVRFYPQSGEFSVEVDVGENCIGTFKPGATRTWNGTRFLDNVEGETHPERIVETLGIRRSFLDRKA